MENSGPLSEAGLIRLLDHEGNRISNPSIDKYAENLTPADLRSFWRAMTLTRAIDMEATSLQRQGQLGLWVQSFGQEAAQIGSASVTRGNDYIFPSYREHGVAFVKDVDPVDLMRLFRGVAHGGWNPSEHDMHLYTLVIGAHTVHAVGYGMALNWDGLVASGDSDKDGAVICYFGDGATSQGDTNEALVFAAVNDAPVVFFCQNNQFAISEPTTRQSKVPISKRGEGFGIPSVRVDGNDVIASYAVTAWAMEHARSGQGPVFVEALTYRRGAHTTSDDPTRYRTRAEEEYWEQRDPIDRLTKYLSNLGELSEEYVAGIDAEAKEITARMRNEVRSMQEPATKSMFENIYAAEHATVTAESQWWDEYEASFVDTSAQGAH